MLLVVSLSYGVVRFIQLAYQVLSSKSCNFELGAELLEISS